MKQRWICLLLLALGACGVAGAQSAPAATPTLNLVQVDGTSTTGSLQVTCTQGRAVSGGCECKDASAHLFAQGVSSDGASYLCGCVNAANTAGDPVTGVAVCLVGTNAVVERAGAPAAPAQDGARLQQQIAALAN